MSRRAGVTVVARTDGPAGTAAAFDRVLEALGVSPADRGEPEPYEWKMPGCWLNAAVLGEFPGDDARAVVAALAGRLPFTGWHHSGDEDAADAVWDSRTHEAAHAHEDAAGSATSEAARAAGEAGARGADRAGEAEAVDPLDDVVWVLIEAGPAPGPSAEPAATEALIPLVPDDLSPSAAAELADLLNEDEPPVRRTP
ncbi:hypothetical protein [Microbispora sp. ATCC PTA-5024]|uniref:hypothetical protein n=1 Tax=Microbispora sp. ATCC PTA-5024 TaxID=316330 RepID=UPI0003DBD0B1|nr:hypothetical protein [Microbispora sp. ATCC PTA-5024]ETK33280.1 hypothetical protein MPTA5024_25155 [Microbispora sp. ATCC PTA-5024]